MLAMGSESNQIKRTERLTRLASYHFGRLATYLVLGGLAVLVNTTMTRLSGSNTVTRTVGWSIGVLMIGLGTMRLMSSFTRQNEAVSHSAWAQVWTKQVISLRKRYAKWNVLAAAFSWGLTSTLLPCGWLYLFVLAAAAAPSNSMTLAIMFAFWLGTLPLLSVAAWSWVSMSSRWKVLLQPIAAICIISFGLHTLLHRSDVEFPSIAGPVQTPQGSSTLSFDMIRSSLQAELPCCVGIQAENDQRGVSNAGNP